MYFLVQLDLKNLCLESKNFKGILKNNSNFPKHINSHIHAHQGSIILFIVLFFKLKLKFWHPGSFLNYFWQILFTMKKIIS